MTSESFSATITIEAPATAIFSILADPGKHTAIDGGSGRQHGAGSVVGALGRERLTAAGQVFRMAMTYKDQRYQTVNRVRVFDPPLAIAWEPGYDAGQGDLRFGGWLWRYDLTPVAPSATEVTLSYDWSAATEEARRNVQFPPFPPAHLQTSLTHLAALVAG